MTKLTEAQQKQLENEGYLVMKGVLAKDEVDQLLAKIEALWAEEGEQAGSENYIEPHARRLANLVDKGELFHPILIHPQVLQAACLVLGEQVRLSMYNARDALPRSDPKMPFHCDTDHGGKPDESGYKAFTAIWMLDRFTRQNGATRLVPGSHRSGLLPKEGMPDIYAPHPEEVCIEGQPGDVLAFNGHCWHTGGPNNTDATRRALLVHYARPDQPRRLDYNEALSPEIKAGLGPLARQILGLDDR
jgi:ectoine hydroxylase-related dioxygenase (phytanoyl-CoA dioxygenase family)